VGRHALLLPAREQKTLQSFPLIEKEDKELQKARRILQPVIYLFLCSAGIYIIKSVSTQKMFYFHYYTVIAIQISLSFVLGILINAVNSNFKSKALKLDLFYFIVSLICIVCIILLYALYEFLPQFFIQNLSIIQFLLSVYAGANFFSAFTKEQAEK
jgi:hypothetical protein